MSHYSFDATFKDPDNTYIPGFVEFANSVIGAINAINAARAIPSPTSQFVCGVGMDEVESQMSISESFMEAIDSIIEDVYDSMMVLDNPFAHLTALIVHLAGIVHEDGQGATGARLICNSSLLMLQDRLIYLYVVRTGFTAKK